MKLIISCVTFFFFKTISPLSSCIRNTHNFYLFSKYWERSNMLLCQQELWIIPYVKSRLLFQGRGGVGVSQTLVWSITWGTKVVQGEATTEMRLMRKRFRLGPWYLAGEITGLITPGESSTYWHEWEELERKKRHLLPQYTFRKLRCWNSINTFSVSIFLQLSSFPLPSHTVALGGTGVSGVIYKDILAWEVTNHLHRTQKYLQKAEELTRQSLNPFVKAPAGLIWRQVN